MPERIRVVIADDHPIVRAGLAGLLNTSDGIDVAGQAGDGQEALRMVAELEPDVVLMDLRMPGLDGASATARIHSDHPNPKVLVLTTYDGDADIMRSVEAGAVGYLLKDTAGETIIEAVFAAARGETVLAPAVAAKLVSRMRMPEQRSLSAREVEVLEAVSTGLSNSEIAARLFIAEATVKTHLLRIFAKLDVEDRTRAVVVAMERRLLRR
ncbi:response regulator [Arthrobacter castelli]|uniref:response regulator n=1 Tax=Arthrobacter castelli TaxID=271431 RepID=UPI0004159916|nr:response regulator transcription factor [Arthrobacter castelli]